MPPGATMPHDPDAVAIHQSRRAQIVNRRFVPVHPHLRFIERMRRAARWRGADLQHCDALVRQGLRQIHRPARPQRRADRATPIPREVLTPPPNMSLTDQRITSVLAISDGIEQSAPTLAAFLVTIGRAACRGTVGQYV